MYPKAHQHLQRVRRPVMLAASALSTLLPSTATASYAHYVGKNLTADGSVLLGGTGEEVSSHWLQIVPPADHSAGSTISAGFTAAADMPGELMKIAQVPHTFADLSMNYGDFKGLPAPSATAAATSTTWRCAMSGPPPGRSCAQ